MKLQDLQEAKYHKTNYIHWVEQNRDNPQDALSSDGHYQGSQLTDVDVDGAKQQLTDHYGEPQHYKKDAFGSDILNPHYLWEGDGIEVVLFPKTKELQFVVYVANP